MNNKQVEDLIYQYHWRKRELDRIFNILFGGSTSMPSFGMVSQYGIEATLPKPNTTIKSPAEIDVMDAWEQRLYKRYKEFRDMVKAIERIVDYLEDVQHQIILDCIMEGMSYRSIADHLGVNRNKIREMKENMLFQLCQKCHFLHDLLEKDSAW